MDTTESLKTEISNLLKLNFKYPCAQCDYTAYKAKYILEHVKSVHQNIKKPHKKRYAVGEDYKCEFCDFKTIHKSSLKAHTESIHENVLWYCNECDFIVKRRSSLYAHQKRVHEGIQFPCDTCDHKASTLTPL